MSTPRRPLPEPVTNDVPPTRARPAAWMRQDTDVPAHGRHGVAWRAPGHANPDSAAYEAWLFQPDGDERAYYCFEDDLELDAFEDTQSAETRLTARDAITSLRDSVPELAAKLANYAEDPSSIARHDACLDKCDAMVNWLTVFRRAVVDGRLGL